MTIMNSINSFGGENMQYVIQVSGNVANKQNKAYVVNSSSMDEAKKIATQKFCDEFSTNTTEIYAESNKRTGKSIAALICMFIPIILSFVKWKNGHETIVITPDYISCLYGAFIYGAFVVRFKGVQRTVSSFIDMLFCVVIVLLLASFAKTILITKSINVFGLTEINIDTNMFLIVAIVLSWLGLKAVSFVCIGGVVIDAFCNITALNAAMGNIYGPLYIICAFIGIILYISIEPAFMEAMFRLKSMTAKGLYSFKKDEYQIKETKNKNEGV